jgi:hypothetical protein
MSIPTSNKSLPTADEPHSEDKGEICENCGNIYRIEWLKEGDDYNDFGQRYCTFCGLLTNEW